MIRLIWITIRPKQWIKNLFVYAPLVFAQKLFDQPSILLATGAFGVFCMMSSAVYIINDLMDIKEDREHPVKRLRPIASGALAVDVAWGATLILATAAMVSAWAISPGLFWMCALYGGLNIAYSLRLKHVVLIDVFIIAAGFFLRVLAGALAIQVEVSSWLVICTILLALFLSLCKRRHELVILEDNAGHHRKTLSEYTPYFLDQLISVVTASTVVAYSMYTVSADVVKKFGTQDLRLTIPFVLYGIFRYLYLVHRKDEGGFPTKILLTDMPLVINVILWGITVLFILYY